MENGENEPKAKLANLLKICSAKTNEAKMKPGKLRKIDKICKGEAPGIPSLSAKLQIASNFVDPRRRGQAPAGETNGTGRPLRLIGYGPNVPTRVPGRNPNPCFGKLLQNQRRKRSGHPWATGRRKRAVMGNYALIYYHAPARIPVHSGVFKSPLQFKFFTD